MELDLIDKKILNLLQSGFPIIRNPFSAIAKELDIDEMDLINRITFLRENRIIRQISAIFDTKNIGYKSCLVAAKIDPAIIEESAKIINEHPGVSHNYLRTHEYNLWFTVAVPPDSIYGLEKTVEILMKSANAASYLLLPAIHLFKIGLKLDMEAHDDSDEPIMSQNNIPDIRNIKTDRKLDDLDIRSIRALQKDIPIVKDPFDILAAEMDIDPNELIDRANEFLKNGIMRRYASVLNHRNSGFNINAMGVWIVPDELVDQVGEKMSTFRSISHCYLRPTFPGWPYNMFTMIHSRNMEESDLIFKKIVEETKIDNYSVLYSTKEYKKIRINYFSTEFIKWEEKNKNILS